MGPGLQAEGYLWDTLQPEGHSRQALPPLRPPIKSLLLQTGAHTILSHFHCLPSLIRLEIRGMSRCDSIEGLEGAPLLTSLTLEENPVLRVIKGLEGLKALQDLSLQGCPKMTLPDSITELTTLRDLNLGGIIIPSLAPLLTLHELISLDISFSQGLQDVTLLSSFPALRQVRAPGLPDTHGWVSCVRCDVAI